MMEIINPAKIPNNNAGAVKEFNMEAYRVLSFSPLSSTTKATLEIP